MNLEQAKDNEAQVIYEMIKASNGDDGTYNYPSTLKGIEATALVVGNTITLTYADNTVSVYTKND